MAEEGVTLHVLAGHVSFRQCVYESWTQSYLFQTEIQTLEEQNEILTKEKEELEAKVKASNKLYHEQAGLVKDKQEVIMALSSKVKKVFIWWLALAHYCCQYCYVWVNGETEVEVIRLSCYTIERNVMAKVLGLSISSINLSYSFMWK